ncbi:hypothetical protein EB796_009205 [Bugula neritina]|uniref:Uncharacterized protein n=1 Tax=Bugula neritina TaxID=10212 RepID=A0A7J7K4H5_BUGNE|nr:hypothetical protein EB796_009205 [Bugula neritina]
MLSTEENGAAASKSDHSVSVMSSDADLTTSAARSDSGEDAHGDSSGVSKDTEILITPTDQNVGQRTHSALGEFLMCFSLYTNGYKLLSTKQPPGSLKCLHGIRFLSLTWVILGHTLVFSLNSVGKSVLCLKAKVIVNYKLWSILERFAAYP